jgi:cyanophycinase-like exopeptidase
VLTKGLGDHDDVTDGGGTISAICLQGGAEFQPGCEPMDAAMLSEARSRAERDHRREARVLVAPFAGRPGRERQIAGNNAHRWYRELGAQQVTVVLDEGDGFVEALGHTDLLVLPGGSPQRLLEALVPHADRLRAATRTAATAISGASAGAMVLCRWTVLPSARPRIVPGLGIADVDLVLPHFRGSSGWLDAARSALPANAVVLGLPERSGVIFRADGTQLPVGVEPIQQLTLAQ